MRDLVFLLATSLITLAIWQGINIKKIYETETIPQNLLEKTVPISGTIDIEFIENLGNPADE